MWEINNYFQVISFLRSVVLGMILALAYDILKAYRGVKRISDLQIFFQDVIYSVIAAFTVFLFLLSVTNGEIRGFILIGILVGFAASRYTLSVLWCKLLKLVMALTFKLCETASAYFYKSFDVLTKNITFFWKKTLKTVKKHLKNLRRLLYTKNANKI